MRNLVHICFIAIVATMLTACGGSASSNANDTESEDSIAQEARSKNLVGMINGTIYCLPSPYEMMKHIQELNLEYNQEYPNPVGKFSSYESSFKRLLNMGVYGIDISYLSLYDQTTEALNYFGALKSLANRIELSTVFDAQTMERLENNMGDKDSLLVILTSKFRESDRLLKGENQKAEASLIMAGCWIESLYLLTQIQKNAPDKVTTQKIAEHKFAAEAILNILRPYYEKSPEFKDLIDEIVDICYEFDGIDFNYTYKEPTTYPNKHLTVINSESSLNVYPEHIKLISEKIEKLRKNVVQ